MNKLKVKDYMTKNVITIDRDATLYDALHKMVENGIHSLIVVDSAGKPVGIVTTDDILSLMENNGEPNKDMPIAEFMEAALVTIDPDYDLQKAVSIMTRNKLHRLPVIRNKVLLGIITGSDILRAFKEVKIEGRKQ